MTGGVAQDWGCKGASVRDQEPWSWGQHVAHTDQMGPFILTHTRSSAVKAATTGLGGSPQH